MSVKTARLRRASTELAEAFNKNYIFDFKIKRPFYLNPKHKEFYNCIKNTKTKIGFVDGPAGSMKTYIAVYAGLELLRVRRNHIGFINDPHSEKPVIKMRLLQTKKQEHTFTLADWWRDEVYPNILNRHQNCNELDYLFFPKVQNREKLFERIRKNFVRLSNDLGLSVDIGESAPSGVTITNQMFSQTDNGDFDLSTTGTYTADFVATATTAYITIYSKAAIAEQYTTIDNVVISQYSTIRDTASGFSNFSTGMKLRVVDSTSNDTDESANTSTGYYTINNVYNNEYISLTDTLTDESAGSTIKVIGSNQNYIDLIKC